MDNVIQEKSSIRWLPVEGYEGLYEVSELGQVRSIDRIVIGSDNVSYPFKGKILSPTTHKDTGYKLVSLWKGNKGSSHYVHRLVCIAFHEYIAGKEYVNHIDGDRVNNHYLNLEWCTPSENSTHAVNTGLRTYTNKLTKGEFIECLQHVINGCSYAYLTNFVPYQVPFLSVKLRKIAIELGLEGELDESLRMQKILRARKNGSKNTRQPNNLY